jgi:hypothetical protein
VAGVYILNRKLNGAGHESVVHVVCSNA